MTFSAGSTETGPAVVMKFTVGASAFIAPVIGNIDGSAADYNLYFKPTSTDANGQFILLTGYETKISGI